MKAAFYDPNTFVFRRQTLVVVVIITSAKEDVRRSSIKSEKSLEGRRSGWTVERSQQ